MRELPIKDLTVGEDVAANIDLTSVIAQATIVRAIVNRVRSPGRIEIPGLVGLTGLTLRRTIGSTRRL